MDTTRKIRQCDRVIPASLAISLPSLFRLMFDRTRPTEKGGLHECRMVLWNLTDNDYDRRSVRDSPNTKESFVPL